MCHTIAYRVLDCICLVIWILQSQSQSTNTIFLRCTNLYQSQQTTHVLAITARVLNEIHIEMI
jgi:hypothetical protein